MTRVLLSILLLVLVVAACGQKEKAPGPYAMEPAEFEKWEIALVEMRIEKNEAFTDPQQTPMREADLATFEGLNYYFPKADLRFKTPLVAAEDGAQVSLTKRRGEEVPYVRKGHVAFTYEGKVHKLDIFGPAEGEDYLWLPFFDATSGQDTYAGGRYIDVEMNDEGLVDLDFNYAYNPLCDYNPDKYNCTLPPLTNRLEFAVEAGEKIFGAGDH